MNVHVNEPPGEDSDGEEVYEGISDDEDDDDAAMEDPNMNAIAHGQQPYSQHPSQAMLAQQHAAQAQAHIQAQAQAQAHGQAAPHHGMPHGHVLPHAGAPQAGEPVNHMNMNHHQQQQVVEAAANTNPAAAVDAVGPAENAQNSSSSTTSLDASNEPNLEGYERTDRIGQGAYGIVYRGVQRSTGVTVAIKRIPFADAAPEGGVPCNVIREISLLRELDHPNVVRLLDVNQARPGELYLVFEYVAHDLKTFLDKSQNTSDGSSRQGLPPQVVRSFLRQILEGVGYCHTYRILHRDLKPHNVSFTCDK